MRTLIALLAVLWLALPAFAVNPDEMLADPVLEARARAISEGLRCLVCQNQSIDDSDADLAHELRVIVRERLTAGDSDAEVRQYLVDRYGEFVLLQPVLALHTILLWAAPPAVLLVGLMVVIAGTRRRRNVPESAELTEDEAKALAALENPGPGSNS